jgi:hypothetical protein
MTGKLSLFIRSHIGKRQPKYNDHLSRIGCTLYTTPNRIESHFIQNDDHSSICLGASHFIQNVIALYSFLELFFFFLSLFIFFSKHTELWHFVWSGFLFYKVHPIRDRWSLYIKWSLSVLQISTIEYKMSRE